MQFIKNHRGYDIWQNPLGAYVVMDNQENDFVQQGFRKVGQAQDFIDRKFFGIEPPVRIWQYGFAAGLLFGAAFVCMVHPYVPPSSDIWMRTAGTVFLGFGVLYSLISKPTPA